MDRFKLTLETLSFDEIAACEDSDILTRSLNLTSQNIMDSGRTLSVSAMTPELNIRLAMIAGGLQLITENPFGIGEFIPDDVVELDRPQQCEELSLVGPEQ